MTQDEFDAQYPRLAHALQSGVAASISLDDNDSRTSPTSKAHSGKMLRTGVNMAMVENAALWKLLIDKGVITFDEMRAELVQGLRAEVAKYEAELSTRMGRTVTLG